MYDNSAKKNNSIRYHEFTHHIEVMKQEKYIES